MKVEKQLYLENHTTHKDDTCTVTLVRTCIDSNDTSIVGLLPIYATPTMHFVCGVRAHGKTANS